MCVALSRNHTYFGQSVILSAECYSSEPPHTDFQCWSKELKRPTEGYVSATAIRLTMFRVSQPVGGHHLIAVKGLTSDLLADIKGYKLQWLRQAVRIIQTGVAEEYVSK
jgi:hypothetical protein